MSNALLSFMDPKRRNKKKLKKIVPLAKSQKLYYSRTKLRIKLNMFNFRVA